MQSSKVPYRPKPKLPVETPYRQTVDGFVPMFTPKLGADKEFRPIRVPHHQAAAAGVTPSAPAPAAAFPGLDATLENDLVQQYQTKAEETGKFVASLYFDRFRKDLPKTPQVFRNNVVPHVFLTSDKSGLFSIP